MKTVTVKLLFVAAFLCTMVLPAHAWDCTAPGQIRVQVPSGTVGNGTGDGSGQVVTVEGITFQCQAPPSDPSTSNTNTNKNKNSNSNTNNNTNVSGSSSTSTATGGSSTSLNNNIATAVGGAGGQGGSASVNGSGNSSNTNIAEGGSATGGSVKNSGNSSSTSTVKNSGNSTISNSGNSRQNQRQSQSQTSTSSANGNGNNSNDETTNVPHEVASAYAPTIYPTVPCFKGFSAGGQAGFGGLSFGGGKIDQNCAALEAARQAPTLVARCKIFLQNKYVKQAGVTMEDCLGPVVVPPAPLAIVAPAPAPAPVITVNVPEPVVQILPIEQVQGSPVATPKPAVHKHRTPSPCVTAKKTITNDDVDRFGVGPISCPDQKDEK